MAEEKKDYANNKGARVKPDLKTLRYPQHSEPIRARLDRALQGKDGEIEKIRTHLRKMGGHK